MYSKKYLSAIRYPLSAKTGLTLIELFVTISILSILVLAASYLSVAGLKLWDQGYSRSDIRGDVSQALELVSKNLRQAKNIDSLTASSITFTADLGSGDTSYRVYLYNASDPEPNPPYTQATYQLRWAHGTVTYGSGAIIVSDIVQPTHTPFSQSGSLITIDLTVSKKDETIRMRSNVRPRNL